MLGGQYHPPSSGSVIANEPSWRQDDPREDAPLSTPDASTLPDLLPHLLSAPSSPPRRQADTTATSQLSTLPAGTGHPGHQRHNSYSGGGGGSAISSSSSSSTQPGIDPFATAVVIKNIPFVLGPDDLLRQIREYGFEPTALNYHHDNTKTFRGVAFANFKTVEETQRAIQELSGKVLHNRPLRVEPKKRSIEGPPPDPNKDEEANRIEDDQLRRTLQGFVTDPMCNQLEFPVSLSNYTRRKIHFLAEKVFKLGHYSDGANENRRIIVSKDVPAISSLPPSQKSSPTNHVTHHGMIAGTVNGSTGNHILGSRPHDSALTGMGPLPTLFTTPDLPSSNRTGNHYRPMSVASAPAILSNGSIGRPLTSPTPDIRYVNMPGGILPNSNGSSGFSTNHTVLDDGVRPALGAASGMGHVASTFASPPPMVIDTEKLEMQKRLRQLELQVEQLQQALHQPRQMQTNMQTSLGSVFHPRQLPRPTTTTFPSPPPLSSSTTGSLFGPMPVHGAYSSAPNIPTKVPISSTFTTTTSHTPLSGSYPPSGSLTSFQLSQRSHQPPTSGQSLTVSTSSPPSSMETTWNTNTKVLSSSWATSASLPPLPLVQPLPQPQASVLIMRQPRGPDGSKGFQRR